MTRELACANMLMKVNIEAFETYRRGDIDPEAQENAAIASLARVTETYRSPRKYRADLIPGIRASISLFSLARTGARKRR